jgi:probable addiction module antidote protein
MKTRPYREVLLANLTNPTEAEGYLNAVLEEYPEGFLKALRNVAQARQMSKVAQDAGIQRESLYRALSDDGNPTLETLTAVLSAVGLKISIATVEEVVPTHSSR